MLDFLKDILKKYLDELSLRDFLRWSKQYLLFFIKPKSFFKDLYKQTYIKQVSQIFFYILISLISYTFFSPTDKIEFSNDSIKIILVSSLIYMPISLINYASIKLLKIKDFNFWYPCSFVFVTTLITQNIALFFNFLFIKNEDYTFLFLQHLINSLDLIFSLFGFWLVMTLRYSRVIKGVLLNLLMFNLLFLGESLINIDWDDNSTSNGVQIDNTDAILKELDYYGNLLKNYSGVPYSTIVVLDSSDRKIKQLTLKDKDSIFLTDTTNYEAYKRIVYVNSKIVDSIMPMLLFERNKKIFRELSLYYKDFGNYYTSELLDSSIIIKYKFQPDPSNNFTKEYTEYKIDTAYVEHLYASRELIEKLNALNYKATYPDILPTYILFPYYYIGNKLGAESVHKTTTF